MSFPFAQMATTVSALQRGAYDRTCYVQAATQTGDAYGGTSTVWADVAGPLPCSLSPMPGREALRAGAVESWGRALLKLDYFETAGGVGIRADHRVRLGGTEAAPEEVYAVEGVEDVQGAGCWLHVVLVKASGEAGGAP